MNARSRVPKTVRTRRSHADRTAETRRRVKDAVVESIVEIGFKRTTAAEIAARAGVTWGAVQHHFGDKDGILMAVLEESFERFASILGEPPEEAVDLEERASVFVQRAWEHLGSAHYRTTLEILLNLSPDLDPAWREDMLAEWFRIWRAYFHDASLSPRKTGELMHYAISVLSGLATTRTLEGPDGTVRSRELHFLTETLVRHLDPENGE